MLYPVEIKLIDLQDLHGRLFVYIFTVFNFETFICEFDGTLECMVKCIV